jgi:SAM-dependent methyltransferase
MLMLGFGRRRRSSDALPIPPEHMRAYVGPREWERFDNPTGGLVYQHLPPEAYEAVFDFGCGCGRVARQLIQQRPRPERYLGVDLHREMIDWCRSHLSPHARGFEFRHHDVRDSLFNPGDHKPEVAPFPAADGAFTLVEALSVFTHLVERHAAYYLREAARVLRPDGVLNASFFLFDKIAFPMMDEDHNALYVSDSYPPTAVVFDRDWLRRTAAQVGLRIVEVHAPEVRGYQWLLVFAPVDSGRAEVALPPDTLAVGVPHDLSGRSGGG